MEMIKPILAWLVVAITLFPVFAGIAWVVVESFIVPNFIPRSEIARLADGIMSRYPDDPEAAARFEELAAWYRIEPAVQGSWRRVRKELRRRLSQNEFRPR